MTPDPITRVAAVVEATSVQLSAAVILADEVRAILHDRGDVPDGVLLDRIDAAYDRYWHARRATPAQMSGAPAHETAGPGSALGADPDRP